MKPYLYPVLFLLSCLSAAAQTAQTNKIVYLMDGSNVKGTVTVIDSAGMVMVEDKYKETRYYQKNLVAKIDDEPAHQRSYDLQSKGYVCHVELGGTEIIARDGGASIPAFSVNVVNSYQISPFASIGLGLGTEIAESNTETFALDADSRLYLVRSNISPFFDIAYGFTAMFTNLPQEYYFLGGGVYYNVQPYQSHLAVTPGMLFNPSFGIRVAASKKVAITASLGYKLYYLHNANEFPYYNTFNENADGTYSLGHALTFKTGFQF